MTTIPIDTSSASYIATDALFLKYAEKSLKVEMSFQTPTTELSLEEGKSLFSPQLLHTKVFWERTTDTKVLIGWNAATIILAFRGTASMSNVFADLQVRISALQ